MRGPGRPTGYSDDLAGVICERLSQGESMRSIARDETMPAMTTLFKWLREHEEFAQQYAIAKTESAEAWAEQIAEIGQDTLEGKYDPAAARVAIDAYKWTASKLKPKRYGDRLDHSVEGQIILMRAEDV